MNKIPCVLASLALLCEATNAIGYDAETHGLMMYAAYARSSLRETGPGSVLTNFGLDRLSTNLPFDAYWINPPQEPTYLDGTYVPTGMLIYRHPSEYERCQIQHIAPWMDPTDPMFLSTDPTRQPIVTYLPISNWLMRGVLREDDLNLVGNIIAGTDCAGATPDRSPHGDNLRVFNHFYDPINDRPLTTLANVPVGKKSVDWALGYIDSFDPQPEENVLRDNLFSYIDARNHEWRALTWEYVPYLPYSADMRSEDGRIRQYEWATTFRALGDVVHLLQDGAQPQHVRDDPHSPGVSAERQAYESYTNARVWPPAKVNDYVKGFFGGANHIPTIVLGMEYPKPMFSTSVRFFSTRSYTEGPSVLPDDRLGLIDYTNRGFFTGGTLPGMPRDEFLEPPSVIDAAHGYAQSDVPCLLSAELAGRFHILCTHWMRWPWDAFAAGYTDELPHQDNEPSPFDAPPVVTQSVFKAVSDVFNAPAFPPYAVGLEEFQAMANFTVPRAIAYSSSLIDYFFRGSLELSSPPAGLIAVVDQGVDHSVSAGVPVLNDGSYKTFGFSTVRIRAKNTTPAITDADPAVGVVPQTMTSGKLVAIARYHRNPCYRPDLSGEYVKKPDGTLTVPSGCAVIDTRAGNPEISVSQPIVLDGNGNLPTTQGSYNCANVGNINTGASGETCANASPLLEFDFSSDPIPINATDVYLQVAFRGQLGDELDGIAAGIMDISEPNFYTVWNNTDYFLYEGNWVLPTQVPPLYSLPAADTSVMQFCFGDELIMSLAAGQVIHSGWDFLRVATLATTDEHAVIGFSTTNPGGATTTGHGSVASVKRQAQWEDGRGFLPDPMRYGRGITVGTDFASVAHFYPTGIENSSVLALPPLLTAPRGPGLADQGLTQFTSLPQTPCISPQ